ncbi:tRNA lysidine(34) synthetase TilS [Maricaulis virginensis]|uniref:tRNA(Ile)-lysidine synthase n=1 Tax=Maricaulis virginensis TaxID=144022 RepID=A0A9W6MNI6_9PROT|nr:tRNA lysidine(34) synthetase TilS [Maricaulis virginensis]GLK51956.1 tRNA(Ile)-lysidine synthase [Maricaulis virginensis]
MARDPAAAAGDWLDRHAPPGPLAIACSGGSDSLALLLAVSRWAGRTGRTLHVLTVDHGLRRESAGEAAFVMRRAEALGHEAHCLVWTGSKPASGLQEAARQARHHLLARACKDVGARGLLLAHTLDDQIETLAMRLAAGGGWRGAAAMRPVALSPVWPDGRDVVLCRPLLAMRRQALRDWLTGQGERWVEDPSNTDARYTRVRIRQHLTALETSGFDVARLAQLAGDLSALRDAEQRTAARLAAQACEILPWGGMRIDACALNAAVPVICHAVLEAAALAVSGRESLPGRRAIVRLSTALAAGKRATAGGVMLAPWQGRTWLVRDPGAVTGRVDRPGTGSPDTDGVWDGRFVITGLGAGLTAGPLGRTYDGLDRRDILDAVPGFARPGLLAVREGGREDGTVIALAGMPGREDSRVQIEPLQAHRFCTRLLSAAPAVWFDTD